MREEYYPFRSNLAQRTASMRDGYYTSGTNLAATVGENADVTVFLEDRNNSIDVGENAETTKP